MDSFGGLVDKLVTVALKTKWNFQKILENIGSPNQLWELYKDNPNILYNQLKVLSDLNKQSDVLRQEIDALVEQMIDGVKSGMELDDGKFIQRKYKTY